MLVTKILLVDSDLRTGEALKEELEAAGKFNVFWAKQATDAMKLAKAFLPDLIFLETMISDMPGTEVANQLKGDLRTFKIPIVFLASADRPAGRDQDVFCHNGHSHHLLKKPVSINEVLYCIKNYVTK